MQILEILKRIGDVVNSDSNKVIAKQLNLQPSTTSTWKKRGTVNLSILSEFCERNDINLIWLLTGKGKMRATEEDAQTDQCDVGCTGKIKEQCRKAKLVLESRTSYKGSLWANIDSFHEAVTDKLEKDKKEEESAKMLQIIKENTDIMQDRIKSLEDKICQINKDCDESLEIKCDGFGPKFVETDNDNNRGLAMGGVNDINEIKKLDINKND